MSPVFWGGFFEMESLPGAAAGPFEGAGPHECDPFVSAGGEKSLWFTFQLGVLPALC